MLWITNTPKNKRLIDTRIIIELSDCRCFFSVHWIHSVGTFASESNYFRTVGNVAHIKKTEDGFSLRVEIFHPNTTQRLTLNFTQTLYFSHSRRLSNMT